MGGRAARKRPQRRIADLSTTTSPDRQIWLMTLSAKDEASDLTSQQKKALKVSIETELAARAAKRATRPRGVKEQRHV